MAGFVRDWEYPGRNISRAQAWLFAVLIMREGQRTGELVGEEVEWAMDHMVKEVRLEMGGGLDAEKWEVREGLMKMEWGIGEGFFWNVDKEFEKVVRHIEHVIWDKREDEYRWKKYGDAARRPWIG